MSEARVSRIAMLRFLIIALVVIVPVAWVWWVTQAASRTWTGGTPGDPTCLLVNNFWVNQCNWTGKVLPVANDDLIFPNSLQQSSSNNFANGTTFNSISVSGGHVMQGNSVSLNSGITATLGTIALSSIKLNNSQTFNAPGAGVGATIVSPIDNNGKNLTLDGPGNFTITGIISGVGGLTKSGTGTTQLVGANSYTGLTSVNQGTLLVFGSQPGSDVVISGATLGGSGTVGRITFSVFPGGSINPGAANHGTGILSVNGNAFFPSAGLGSFDVDLNGATVGSGYDQLKVNGTVSLGLGVNSVLNVSLGFTPLPGATFTVIDNDGTDAVTETFTGKPEGSTFTVNSTTFLISYRGGDGNDIVLHVPETKAWTGGGVNNSWTTGANWSGNTAPQAGDDLIFPSGALRLTNTNDFPAGTVFDSIVFSGSSYHVGGNAIALNLGITDNAGAQTNNIVDFTSIKLNANQTFTKVNPIFMNIGSAIDTNGKTLTLDGAGQKNFDGVITGSGGLIINGTGDVQLRGGVALPPHTFTGPTIINSGSFTVFRDVPNSPIQLKGGVLEGNKIVNSIQATGGTMHQDTELGAPMTSMNDVTLNSAVTFAVGILRSPTNLASGGLNLGGALNLGNSTLTVTGSFISTPIVGDAFIIISKTSAGAIQGTFNNLPEGSLIVIGGVSFRISYAGADGNDVVLTVPPPTKRTWDGGSAVNSNWQANENWEGDLAPLPGDDLEFPAGKPRMSNNNDFPANTTFNTISILDGGYTLNGNAVRFNGNFINNNGPSNLTISTVSLALSGPGGLTNASSNPNSRLILTGANGYTGTTTINNGSLVVNGSQAASPVVMNDGTLEGIGTVGPVTANDGAVRPGTLIQGSSTGVLNVSGGVTFASNAQFSPTILTSNNNLTNSSLNVVGAVTLNNCRLFLFLNSDAIPLLSPTSSFKIINNDGADAVNGTFSGFPEGSSFSLGGRPFKVTYKGGDGNDVALTADNLTVQFNASLFTVGEGDQRVNLTITRSGNTSAAASVGITTSDAAASQSCSVFNGNASARCDYTITFGTVDFAAGETSKSFSVPIVDDSYAEGNENFTVSLNNPSGAFLETQSTTTVTIVDNETTTGPNPADTTGFFVRQHYLDFFSREPDTDGFNFWVGTITSCGIDSQCVEVKRINASAAFYISIEFQGTGYLVERIYKTAYGDAIGTSTFPFAHQLPVPIVRFAEFLPDTQEIGRGVVVGQGNWEQTLENNKQAFAGRFVQRTRFLTAFPASMTPAQLVDKLNQNAGNPLSQTERDQLVNELTAGTKTRAQVLRAVAEDPDLNNAESNRAFVLMQYFGYLRRNPNDAPDPDHTGYDFWLTKLNQFNGNFIDAEMVKAFITSGEYRQRFGP